MRIEQVSPHIWSLRVWMFIPIHVWLVVHEQGVTLVDAGMSSMGKGILRQVDAMGQGTLQRIVLTHGHSDHTGAVAPLLKRNANDLPVYAHKTEIPYLEGDEPYPRRTKAVATVAKGIVKPLPESKAGKLLPIGGLVPYWTPGHSPGHTVYYHEQDRVLLAGDLFTSKAGKLKRPMAVFTGSMEEAVRSSYIIQRLKPKRVEVCHGGPVFDPADQMTSYLKG